ncbi:hypothetical protein [Aeoliella sp. SH292]|uniref:hypothetical protein n=1 Tax=Aeoliella sp. SH292 TaxID=3454464 RepID=UPI003F9B99CF
MKSNDLYNCFAAVLTLACVVSCSRPQQSPPLAQPSDENLQDQVHFVDVPQPPIESPIAVANDAVQGMWHVVEWVDRNGVYTMEEGTLTPMSFHVSGSSVRNPGSTNPGQDFSLSVQGEYLGIDLYFDMPMYGIMRFVGSNLQLALVYRKEGVERPSDFSPRAGVVVLTFSRQPQTISPLVKQRFAKKIADTAGMEIMKAAGGGRDLVTTVQRVDYDPAHYEYEMDIIISFNGSIRASNNYQVAGRITVRRSGSGATFSRTGANENYLALLRNREDIATGVFAAAILAAAVEGQK